MNYIIGLLVYWPIGLVLFRFNHIKRQCYIDNRLMWHFSQLKMIDARVTNKGFDDTL